MTSNKLEYVQEIVNFLSCAVELRTANTGMTFEPTYHKTRKRVTFFATFGVDHDKDQSSQKDENQFGCHSVCFQRTTEKEVIDCA